MRCSERLCPWVEQASGEKEKVSEDLGDFWTFIAINPATKLIFAHISGKRITENAIKFLQIVKTRLKSLSVYITTDCTDMYVNGINSVFGDLSKDKSGHIFPNGFAYAQVIKSFAKGRWVALLEKLLLVLKN